MDDMTVDAPVPTGDKKTEWEQEPSLLDLKHDLEEARSTHDAKVSRIDNWLDNLYVRNGAIPKTGNNRSKYVPKLIRKQAEWRYSSLSEPFLSSPDLFDAQPVTWEDTKAATQNALVLNDQFTSKIDRQAFIDEYVRTAVDEGTVIVKTLWEYEDEEYLEVKPIVEYVPDPDFAPALQQLAVIKETNPNEYRFDVPEEMKMALEYSIEMGTPFRAKVVGQETVTSTRVLKNQPAFEVCDYRNTVVDPTCQGDIDKASFVVHSFETSLSELEKSESYFDLDKINLTANSPLGEPDHETKDNSNFNFRDRARQKFIVYEYWGYYDIDGSGAVRPIVASWVGNTLIRLEESPFPDGKLPFVSVSYLPVRKEVYGEPDGELLEDNQKLIGAVSRGMIDILGRSANGQTGIRKDMLDSTNRRRYEKGLDYVFNPGVDPRQGVHMHTYPEIPQSALVMVQSQNQEAESLTGVRSFASGITGSSLGEVAAGVREASDAASKRELGILRRLAKGIVKLGYKVAAMNAVFLSEEEVVRITNDDFVSVRRDDLAGKIDLRLTVSTAEEDNQKAQELAFMLQTMGQNLDFNMNKILLSKIAKLRKMPDLAKQIEDFEPQPDPMEQELKRLEIEEKKAEINERNAKALERQAQAQLDLAKAKNLDSDTDMKDLDFVEQESGVKQERELQKQGEQARANMELEKIKAKLNNKPSDTKASGGSES